MGYTNYKGAFDEKSQASCLGDPLREKFKAILKQWLGLKIVCDFKVHKLRKKDNRTVVLGE